MKGKGRIPVGKKFHAGIYISILLIFAAICVMAVYELASNNSLSQQIRGLKGNSSQAEQISRLQSQIESERQANSQLSSQLNQLQSSYNDLQSQVTKIGQMKATSKGKVAYLTFDDGPSKITPQVLDALKASNVHATFFIVGTNAEDYPSLIKREYSEGNGIGIHSWTHSYPYIYASETNFFEDFNKLKDYLTQLTGVQPAVCRYPGGTNNTVSQKYSDHIMRKIDPEVKAMGFKPYDWNAYAGDAEKGPKPSPEQIVKNVMKSAGSQKTLVVLMHDTGVNINDVTALPELIKELRADGYSFGVLTPFTPAVQFKPY